MGLSEPSNLLKVFIADDSPIVRQRLATMLLELEGIEIIGQAQNSVETCESVQSLNPDVVILDIVMCGRSRIDLLSTIKRNAFAPIVIVFTNSPYPQYRKKCLEQGADFFLDKCRESRKLIEVVRQLISDSLTHSAANLEEEVQQERESVR